MHECVGCIDAHACRYQSLVSALIETFDNDVKTLRKVETNTDVLEVKQLVMNVPRLATMLDGEHNTFRKHWDSIWTSFFESVQKKLRLAACGTGQEQDISDSIAFLQAARKLLQQQKAAPGPLVTPPMVTSQCVFPLPIDGGQLQTLIEQLDGLLGQIVVDTDKIDAEWLRLVEKVDFKTEMTSLDDTLHFIRKLKRQGQAIMASGEYGYLKQAPTADRAITRLSTAASDCIKTFDASKPEDAITVLRNLAVLCAVCPRVIEDDVELQGALTAKITERREEATTWVIKMENELAEKGAEFYAEAEKQHDPVERKKLLHLVTKNLELHLRLKEKLVACQVREYNGTEVGLLSEIKKRIQGMQSDMQHRLRRAENVTADDIAFVIHTIYVTAFDLGQMSILKHAEACIGCLLQDCKGKPGLGLREIGTVLERDLPQGGEIVSSLPQFAELNLVLFQQMTMGKSVEGTVEEVAKLNKLPEAASLLLTVKEVFSSYDATMNKGKFHIDYPSMVRSIRAAFDVNKSIPGLIGGVFGIWSLSTQTEQCPTPRRPLPVQVVAVVRLLAVDKPGSRGVWSWLARPSIPEPLIDASHLAQIKTGQGKSVVLGTLATVLCIVGFQ
jgi:hypothetical protein